MLTNMTYTRAAHWSIERQQLQNISTSLAPSISNPSHFSAHFCSCRFWHPNHQLASISQSDTTSGISSQKVLPRPGRWIGMKHLPELERWKASEETGKECIGAKRSTYKAIPFKFNPLLSYQWKINQYIILFTTHRVVVYGGLVEGIVSPEPFAMELIAGFSKGIGICSPRSTWPTASLCGIWCWGTDSKRPVDDCFDTTLDPTSPYIFTTQPVLFGQKSDWMLPQPQEV